MISAGHILFNFIPENNPELVILVSSLGNTTILSSVGARLVINMKEAGAKGLNEGMGTSSAKATVSVMNFAAPPLAQTSDVSGGDGTIDEIEMADV